MAASGSHNHLSSSSSSMQDGSPYWHMYFSSQQNSSQTEHMDVHKILRLIGWFALFAVIIYLVCSKVLQMDMEAVGGGNDGNNTVRQLQRNQADDGRVDRAPSSTVSGAVAVEMSPPVRTAEPQMVCTYRKMVWGLEGSCRVCLAEMDDGDAVRVLPVCMHYFHAACVGEWLRMHATCPLCRASLVAPTSAARDGEAASTSTDTQAEVDPSSTVAGWPGTLNSRYYVPAWQNQNL